MILSFDSFYSNTTDLDSVEAEHHFALLKSKIGPKLRCQRDNHDQKAEDVPKNDPKVG